MLVWLVLGIVYLVVLYVRDPRRVAEVARVHLDDEPVPVGEPAGPAGGLR